MNNQCEYYIKAYSTGGLKPCENKAEYLLVYYNELEDAAKTMYFCKICHDDLRVKNVEYLNSSDSQIIVLEELKPKPIKRFEVSTT